MRLEPRTRPLTGAERRLLRCKMRRFGREPRQLERRVALVGGGLVAILWLWTLLASDLSWLVVTGFWLVLGALLYAWVLRDLREELGHLPGRVAAFESAVERNEAASFDVVAESYAEFEEVEDEGACYAFDLGDGRLVFLAGQQFYPSARFPSLDFSVVYPLDEDGESADMWIEKRGDAIPPDRVIPGEVRWELAERIPEFPGIVPGTLDRLERSLRPDRS